VGIETEIERAIFFDVEGFGSTATYTPSGGSPVSVNGIYEDDYEQIDAGGSIGIAGSSPSFQCSSADISGAAEGDALTVGGVDYIIRVVMEDGTGVTMLQLEAQ